MEIRNDFNAAINEFVKNIPIPNAANTYALAKTYETNDIIYKCVDYKARKTAQAKPLIFNIKNVAAAKRFKSLNGNAKNTQQLAELQRIKSEAYEEINLDQVSVLNQPELLRLKRFFQRPNEYQTFGALLYSLSAYYDLAGWSLIYKQNIYNREAGRQQLARLYSVPTDKTIIEGGTPYDPIKGYHFDGYYQKSFKAEDCIPIRSFSVNHDRLGGHLYGTSKVQVAWSSLQTYIAAKNREYTSFETGDSAHILYAKNPDAQIEASNDPSLLQKLKDAIFKALRQKDNHQAAVVGMELGHINLASSIKNSITIEAKQEVKEMVASIWGLPSKIVFNDQTSSTYNNMQEDRKRALYDCVFPFLNELEAVLQDLIFESFGLHFAFDYQSYEELNVDRIAEMKEMSTVTFLSKNEMREWFGYDATEGGDGLDGTNEMQGLNLDYDTETNRREEE